MTPKLPAETPSCPGSPEPDYRAPVQSAWADLQQLAGMLERTDLIESLRVGVERFELGIFRLVVMGEIKKGKSSFLNALLGEPDLLPTASDVATSTVYKLLYGPKKQYKVFFLPDVDSGKSAPPQVIQPEEVAAYGTETGNPGNRRRVDFIGVELPSPLLKDGLVLVDTPGVGGLFKAHRDITWRFAPKADAVFFVLDSVEAVISNDEIQFLQELTDKVTKRVYFIQTKTDLASTEQWQSWRDRNQAVLIEKLGFAPEQVLYFPVSSKLKSVADRRHSGRHLQDSGFLAVLSFLHRGLMQAKRRHMAVDLAGQLKGAGQLLRKELLERAQILQTDSREGLERLSKEYAEAHRHVEEWQRTTFPQETRAFNAGLGDLKHRALIRFQEDLDPAGPIVEEILDWLRKNEFNPREVNDLAGKIQQECLARASEVVGQVYDEFNRQVTQLIETTAQRLCRGFVVEGPAQALVPTQSTSAPIKIDNTLNMHFSRFEDMRNAMYGGMAGCMIAGLGVSLVALLFPPAAAVAGIATLIGGCIGGHEADKSAKARRRDEVISRLGAVLQNLMRKAQRQAISQFSDMARAYEQRAGEVLQAVVERQRNLLQKRLQEIDEARSRTQGDNQKQLRPLEEAGKTLDRIEASLAVVH